MGQSVAIAVASALIMFTVVGLVASRGAITRAADEMVPPIVVSAPDGELSPALQQAAARVRVQPQPNGQGFEVTVPAHQYTVIDTGLPGADGSGSGALVVPPLESGHYVFNAGIHDVLVTVVER